MPAADTGSEGPFLDDFSYVPDRVSAADTSTIGGPAAELSDWARKSSADVRALD
jgi:hypothetical protein